jgi:SAM-dependent methyltransferase
MSVRRLLRRFIGFPHLLRRAQYPLILRRVPKDGRSPRILEIGCGEGQLARLLARRGPVFAIDKHLVDAPTDALRIPGRLEFAKADGRSVPCGDGSFDVVAMSSVLQMEEDDRGLLRECRRVLAPGGRMILTVPGDFVGLPFLFGANLPARAIRRSLGLPDSYALFLSSIRERFAVAGRGAYTVASLRDLVREAGFDIEEIEFVPRTLATLVYETLFLVKYVAGRSLSVRGALPMILYPLVFPDRFLPGSCRGCELLVVAARADERAGA